MEDFFSFQTLLFLKLLLGFNIKNQLLPYNINFFLQFSKRWSKKGRLPVCQFSLDFKKIRILVTFTSFLSYLRSDKIR